MSRHFLFITGVSRSGTTFMVSLFSRFGYDVGFNSNHIDAVEASKKTYHSHGGLETFSQVSNYKPKLSSKVEVVKQSWSVGTMPPIDKIIEMNNVKFDNAILMKRDFIASAKSHIRRRMARGKNTYERAEQSAVRLERMRNKLETWLDDNISGQVISLEFPRVVTDFDYLWSNIESLVSDRVSREEAEAVWDKLRDPSYIRY